MEIVIIALVVVVAIGYWIWKESHHKKSESHPLDGATRAAEVTPVLTQVLDVNNDGKVDVDDIKEVVAKVKTATKKAPAKNETGIKKSPAKKAPTKKTTAKKAPAKSKK